MDPPMDKDDQDRTSARRPSRENLARIQQSDDKQRLPAEEAESSHPTRGTIVEMPELQLFDLVAGGAFERALEDMGQQHHGAEGGVWSYLPLFLQMLRDGSSRSGAEAGDRFDKLLRVVVQNRRADSTEDYLNVAKECCALLRKLPAPSSSTSASKTSTKSASRADSRAASPVLGAGPAGSGGGGGTGTAAGPTGAAREEGERASEGAQQAGSNRPERAMTEWDLVIAEMDEESEDEDGDTSTPGVAMPRRDGKQMDLLLEMESLEPQQLMSVVLRELLLLMAAVRRRKGDVLPPAPPPEASRPPAAAASGANDAAQGGAAPTAGPGGLAVEGARGGGNGRGTGAEVSSGVVGGQRLSGKEERRGAGRESGASSESLDLLSQRSLEEELHVLLPVLLAHAPRIRMREATGALLRTRFAPSLLHVSVMNDPLSLESIVLGVCDAVTTVGNPLSAASQRPPRATRRTLKPNRVTQRAERLVMRLCSLGEMTSIKVRSVLVKRRSLPGVCARVTCEILHDAERFLLSVSAASDRGGGGANDGDDDDAIGRRRGQDVRSYDYTGALGGAVDDVASHWFWGHLRESPARATQLLDAVLDRVKSLAREAGAGASEPNPRRDASTATVGDLCSTLRSYCALANLARPALRPQHVRAAVEAPLVALRAALASRTSSSSFSRSASDVTAAAAAAGDVGDEDNQGGQSDSPMEVERGPEKEEEKDREGEEAVEQKGGNWLGCDAAARLEEILLCAIVVTARRLGADTATATATASAATDDGKGKGKKIASKDWRGERGRESKQGEGGGQGQGREEMFETEAEEETEGAKRAKATAEGDPGSGVWSCATALRRLLELCRSEAVTAGGGKDEGASRSRSSSGGSGECFAGLFGTLLLWGSRLEALNEVVGEMLGTAHPLSPLEGVDALEALRDAMMASSDTAARAAVEPPSGGGAQGAGDPKVGVGRGQVDGEATGRERDGGGVAGGWFSEAALAELVKALPLPGRGGAEAGGALQSRSEERKGRLDDKVAADRGDGCSRGSDGGGVSGRGRGGRWPLAAVDCMEEALEQGILMRQRVDVKEWVLSAIARSGTGTGIRARGRRGLALHPSLLRVVCLYASACIPTSPPGRRASAILAGQGAVSAVAATADDFTMTPIFPTEVTEIVRAVDWSSIESRSREPLFPGMPPPLQHPSMASPTLLNAEDVVVGGTAAGGGWKNHEIQDETTAWDAMPALLATCFALYHTHCSTQRNTPFPGPFRYHLRDLPLTRMLRLTAAAAWGDGELEGLGDSCCHDRGMANLHAFLVPAVMDVCPELFCPEQRRVVFAQEEPLSLLGGGATTAVGYMSDSGTAEAPNEEGGFQLLNPAFLHRAIGAVWTAPAVAVGVLRAMLVCPSEILLAVGEEGLKELLPKVVGGDFPRRSMVACLSSAAWMRLYGDHPNTQGMETWTLNALLQSDTQEAALPRAVTYDTMCREPMMVFRCQVEVFSCPYLLRILLKILRSLLLASERTIDQAVVAKQRRWEMVMASARRKNQKAAAEAVAAAAAAGSSAGSAAATPGGGAGLSPQPSQAPPPPQGGEDVEENTSTVDGCMMLLIQQAIVARCLLVVALGDYSGGPREDGTSTKDLASSAQCRKLVCDFVQAMVSECPPLMHLLLRQTLPAEAFVLLLDGVPACRAAALYLGNVMGQQTWEARAFGVRAAALFAERFPTEEAFQACRGALHVLSSMCDSEARAPRGINIPIAGGLGGAGTASTGFSGAGGGGGSVASPPAALLACGIPPSDLVRETFPYAVNMCQAFPSLSGDTISLIESILHRQDLTKMHGTKGGEKLRRRLTKILATLKGAHGATSGDHISCTGAAGHGIGNIGARGAGLGTAAVALGGAWPLTNPAVKRPRLT